MRKEFTLTAEELATLSYSGPVYYSPNGGVFTGMSLQANQAWQHLADVLGFDPATVERIPGKGPESFTAMTYNRVASYANLKQQKIYYQDIVYAICRELDRHSPSKRTTVCGTVNDSTTEVQESVTRLLKEDHEFQMKYEELRLKLHCLFRYDLLSREVPDSLAYAAANPAGDWVKWSDVKDHLTD